MYEFTYHRPTTVRQAVNLLAKHPEGASCWRAAIR